MSDSAVEKTNLARANTVQDTATHTDEKPADTDGHNGDSSKVAKFNTMIDTAEEGKALLAGEDFGGTRQETTKKRQSRGEKSSNKRLSTVDKVLEEAKAVYSDLDTSSEGRSLRKRAPPPPAKEATPPVKRASTMARTAKEGEEFVKAETTKAKAAKKSTTPKKASPKKGKGKGKGRGRKSKGAAEEEEEEEEEEMEAEAEEKEAAEENGESAAKDKDDAASAAVSDSAATTAAEEKKDAAPVEEEKQPSTSGDQTTAAVVEDGAPAPSAQAAAAQEILAVDAATAKDAVAEVVALAGDS